MIDTSRPDIHVLTIGYWSVYYHPFLNMFALRDKWGNLVKQKFCDNVGKKSSYLFMDWVKQSMRESGEI